MFSIGSLAGQAAAKLLHLQVIQGQGKYRAGESSSG